MSINKKILLFIILSVGILPTDIFLYAQENKQIGKVEKLLKEKKIDSANIVLRNMFKDTMYYNKKEKAKFYFLYASSLESQDKEGKAIAYYERSEEIYKVLNDKEKVADIQFAKFSLLKAQDGLDAKKEAVIYLKKYYNYALQNNDKKRLIKAYMSFAIINFDKVNYKTAAKNFDKAIEICKEINDTLSLAKNNNNKGLLISNFYRNQDSARIFYKKALSFYIYLNNRARMFDVKSNIGTSYLNEGNFKDALKYFREAELIEIVNNKNKLLANLYGLMAYSSENLNDFKNAYLYLNKHVKYKKILDSEMQNVAISDILTKYKTIEKEKENIQLKADKENQRLVLLGVLGVFIGFVFVGLLMYKNLQRKRELAEKEKELSHQKILALVKEQELRSIDAMIEGQEKERKRIAEDLHDNLGSKLAVLKLQFDSFVDKADSKKDVAQVKLLKKTGKLLDETYNTVRSMSHVESAGVMIKQGLVESVKLLAESISIANKTEIQVIDFGLETHINSTIEIAVFRVIQELVTNIVKHSNAHKATIDITLFDDVLGVIVADDGVGFNVGLNGNYRGIGLGTVKERIERLNGHLTVDSKQGKGTTIIIEVPVNIDFKK